MTREERATIRARCEALRGRTIDSFANHDEFIGVVLRLLNELDDSDKRNQHNIDCYIGEFEERKRAQADRDRWKSRAEHAEEMLREYESTERQAFIAEIDRWRTRAEALEAERNAAIADMRSLDVRCRLCKHSERNRGYGVPCVKTPAETKGGKCFEWRG